MSEGTALTATYGYTGDLLTEIQTGSTTYSFTYGAFSQRTGVSVGSRPLATYEYTNDANRYLNKLTMAIRIPSSIHMTNRAGSQRRPMRTAVPSPTPTIIPVHCLP